MIAVIANPSEHAVVREFFELFKIPWEFYQNDRHYEAILCSGDVELPEECAKLILLYAGQKTRYDTKFDIPIASQSEDTRTLSYQEIRIPIYRGNITFHDIQADTVNSSSHESAIHLDRSRGRLVTRIGYDLFREIRFLLAVGQPATNASVPALELHIAILRDLIVAGGVPLLEIPPVPEGYKFIACLTHDVDHPAIRLHKFDHTMFGFLYRAVFASFVNLLRGRIRVRSLLINWVAALKLPFVYLGLVGDFWSEFDLYTQFDKEAGSSFFVIPFKDYPGQSDRGLAPKRRASRYCAADIAGLIQELVSRGCEVGLHGIDAWLDSSKGREELEQIRRITGMQDIGVRMHWLYSNEQSPVTLEKGGADYDSTIGYNETIGYRAGTTQVYKPLEATRLLELPLHVMDTALFYPSYLDLSPSEASNQISRIIDNAVQFGGCVTVNWHDRSIAPERLWGNFYSQLVEELRSKGAWFATATQTVQWFRKRRSATFANVWEPIAPNGKTAVDIGEDLPGLRLRVHNAPEPGKVNAIGVAAAACTHDLSLKHSIAEGNRL